MFKVIITDITKAENLYEDSVSEVVLPGEEGELTILDFHQSIVSCLKEGSIIVDDKELLSIKQGIAKMYDSQLAILVER